MKKFNGVSHNACSVYDYNKRRWNVQPSDMVCFCDRDSTLVCVGEVVLLTSDLLHVRRLKDGRIFVISLYDILDWRVKSVDTVRRLPNGVFQQGDRVFLDGELNLPDEEYIIDKFENGRVKVRYSVKGRLVGWYFVREGEVLKKIYVSSK